MPRSERSSPINREIGERIRKRRVLLGLTQVSLGERLGISFQQVQKYEKGTNALTPSRLIKAAEVLTVPIMYFFEGLTDESGAGADEDEAALSWREARMVRRVRLLPPELKTSIEKLVLSVAEPDAADDEEDEPPAGQDEPPRGGRKRRRRGAVWDWADVKRA